MFKTFIFGITLGLAGTAALAYFVPAVDLNRESSLISVQPNGGNREEFHINLPYDRILAGLGRGKSSSGFPPALEWPQDDEFEGSTSEIFKLRNSTDIVVGIAARISATQDKSGSFVHWLLHLPARGTIFVSMQPGRNADGNRDGLLTAGTGEFATLSGQVQESFSKGIDAEAGDQLGLVTTLVGQLGDEE